MNDYEICEEIEIKWIEMLENWELRNEDKKC